MSRAIRQRAQSVLRDFRDETVTSTDDKSDGLKSSAPASPAWAAAAAEGAPTEVSRCLVYCRLRPSHQRDFEDGATQLVSMSGKRVMLKDEKHYDFDGTFGAESVQEDIFALVGVPSLKHAFKGFCAAMLAYGQTGTGKSFTMCCTKPGIEGIIPRSAQFIFDTIASDKKREYEVTGQFVQIYRDQLSDLMSESGKDKVDIRFQHDEGVTLPGCSTHVLTSAEQFMQFYSAGDARRVVTATAMNAESSRGHTALVVWISSKLHDDITNATTRGKITFIDLAGYERFSKTGISNANTIMKDEAKTINASLLSLGHVVTSLSNGDKHVPWRNSKLTRILQDSIGGRSRTTIILTVGPSSDHLHETTNSLQFGQRAMAVKVESRVSVTVDYEKLAAKLQSMLDEKDQRINMLEIQVASNDAERQEMLERHRRDEELLRIRHEEELEELRQGGASAEKLLRLAEQYEVEVENLKEQQQEEVQYHEEVHSKEIIALANEQQRQEELRVTEMSMAQERLIKDFEAKLANAREGTNVDLVRAIAQLSQKDAILAARASEIAKLHEHIETLMHQLREANVEPLAPALVVPTFLDVSQVEEVQERCRAEMESQHAQLVDYRCQVDKLSKLCNERASQINELVSENTELRSELETAGLSVREKQQELSRAQVTMVDRTELETLRVTMQSEIDALERRADMLNAKLEEKTTALKELTGKNAMLQRMSTAAAGGQLSNDSLAGTLRSSHADPSARDSVSFQQGSQAHSKLSELARDNEVLRDENEKLRRLCEERSISLDAVVSAPTAPCASETLNIIEELRSTEFAALLRSAQQREESRVAATARCARLEQQLRASRHESAASEASAAGSLESYAVAALPFDEFSRVLQACRNTTTTLISQLLRKDCRQFEDEDIRTLLEEKDDELVLRDETLLARAAHIDYLQKQLATLEEQLEGAGMSPVCRLPDDVRRAIQETGGDLRDMNDKHKQLEEELHRHQAESDKMQSVLAKLSNERAKEAQVFAAYKASIEEKLKETEEKAKLLEEKEQRIQLAMGDLVQDQTHQEQRARELEEELRNVTRQMMENQAKLAEEQNMSIFDKLKAKLKR